MDFPPPTIPEFFHGRDIFVTGGTGFLGKVLVEKLLRSCPEVRRIYLLCRSRRNLSVEARKKSYSDTPLFDVIKKNDPTCLDKIHLIAGDVLKLGLGISDDDLKLLANVSVVFHVAASVRFDDPLQKAILLNTRGTHEMIKLALTMKKLVSYVHISTAYFNPSEKNIEEKVYKLDYDWRTAIAAAENYSEEFMNAIGQLYSSYAPNTYTFTKGLAEQVCMEYKDQLPMIIYRPSIVTSSESEPIPMWTDSLNGPHAIVIACGHGIMRTMYCRPEAEMNCCPVDLCVKGMIVSAWKKAIVDVKSPEISVYNCASIRSISFADGIGYGKQNANRIPFHDILWAPGGGLTRCKYHNYIRTILYQVLPALLVDMVLRLKGRPPMLMKTQRKILLGVVALRYFVFNSWTIHNEKYTKLQNYLKGQDKETFSLEPTSETTQDYFVNSTLGYRRYLLKHSDDLIPADRRRFKRLVILDGSLTCLFYALIIYYIYSKLSVLFV